MVQSHLQSILTHYTTKHRFVFVWKTRNYSLVIMTQKVIITLTFQYFFLENVINIQYKLERTIYLLSTLEFFSIFFQKQNVLHSFEIHNFKSQNILVYQTHLVYHHKFSQPIFELNHALVTNIAGNQPCFGNPASCHHVILYFYPTPPVTSWCLNLIATHWILEHLKTQHHVEIVLHARTLDQGGK